MLDKDIYITYFSYFLITTLLRKKLNSFQYTYSRLFAAIQKYRFS